MLAVSYLGYSCPLTICLLFQGGSTQSPGGQGGSTASVQMGFLLGKYSVEMVFWPGSGHLATSFVELVLSFFRI